MHSTPALKKRLASLRNWELFNVPFLFGLFAFQWQRGAGPWWLRLYAVLLVCYLLLQGALYWHLKLQSLSRPPFSLPAWFGPRFRQLRASNLILLALYLPLVLVLLALRHTTLADLFWSLPIALFAALEHINYYHLQLSHDNLNDLRYLARHRRLRPAPLATDLARHP